MEAGTVVKYDYFLGGHVTKVARVKNGWYIELEGGVRLTNHDQACQVPDVPVGWLFSHVDELNNILVFGDGNPIPTNQQFMSVPFTLRQGTIYLPQFDKHVEPQFEEPDIETPPDPSHERVVHEAEHPEPQPEPTEETDADEE